MASNIQFTPINENYPVAGQDNNSQGFRDNFTVIKNNFEDAKTEIEDLQDNVARVDVPENDFANNTIVNVNLKNSTLEAFPDNELNTAGGEVSLATGSYHEFEVTDSGTLNLADWPNSNYAKVTVEVTLAAGQPTSTVTFTSENTGNIRREANSVWTGASDATSAIVELDTPGTSRVFEFWSYDNGTTVYAKHIGDFV